MALQEDDINFDDRIIKITKSVDNKLIFCKDTGDYLDNKQPNRHLKAALKKAKIETDIHYHSLRHIFITNCIRNDINLKTIMDWVGHSDTKTTMLIYAEINKNKNMRKYFHFFL